MNYNTLNRWLKPLAILLVIVFIVMLLIPAELTDEQLAEVRPGMTLEQTEELLGKPSEKWKGGACVWTVVTYYEYYLKGQFWHSDLSVGFSSRDGISFDIESTTWIGRTQLLIVNCSEGVITKTWMLPITRSGGGLQGCIDTIKEYWIQWMK